MTGSQIYQSQLSSEIQPNSSLQNTVTSNTTSRNNNTTGTNKTSSVNSNSSSNTTTSNTIQDNFNEPILTDIKYFMEFDNLINLSYFCSHDDYIYQVRFNSSNEYVFVKYSIFDLTNVSSKLFSSNDVYFPQYPGVRFFQYYQGKFYFGVFDDQVSRGFYCVDEDGANIQRIGKFPGQIVEIGGTAWVYSCRGYYFSTDNNIIYKYKLSEASNEEKFLEYKVKDTYAGYPRIYYANGWIYYNGARIKDDFSVQQMSIAGKYALLNNNWMYYFNENALYRSRPDGSYKQLLKQFSFDEFKVNSNLGFYGSLAIKNDYLYFVIGSKLYRIKTDGRSNAEHFYDLNAESYNTILLSYGDFIFCGSKSIRISDKKIFDSIR